MRTCSRVALNARVGMRSFIERKFSHLVSELVMEFEDPQSAGYVDASSHNVLAAMRPATSPKEDFGRKSTSQHLHVKTNTNTPPNSARKKHTENLSRLTQKCRQPRHLVTPLTLLLSTDPCRSVIATRSVATAVNENPADLGGLKTRCPQLQ